QTRCEFSPNECAAYRQQATQPPDAKNQKRRMHAVSDLGRVGKNARAYDAAHDDHRRVKQSKLTTRFCFWRHSERSRGIPWLNTHVASRDVSTFARHDD